MTMARTILLSVVALVLLEAIFVWAPFDVRTAVYQTGWRNNKPVGELVDGFRVTQALPAGLVKIRPTGKKSVHWHGVHSLRTTLRPNCVAIRFATYKRTNGGSIEAIWRQGDAKQSWRIPAADLVDNEYVDFCPRGGIDVDRSAVIDIRGIGGHSGDSATAWLTRSKLEPASVQGGHVGKRSLAIQLTYMQRIGPRQAASLGHGVFLLACACSVGIGGLAFVALRRASGRRRV